MWVSESMNEWCLRMEFCNIFEDFNHSFVSIRDYIKTVLCLATGCMVPMTLITLNYEARKGIAMSWIGLLSFIWSHVIQ